MRGEDITMRDEDITMRDEDRTKRVIKEKRNRNGWGKVRNVEGKV